MAVLTGALVRSLLRYDPLTGVFTRIGGRYDGHPAGCLMQSTGHVQVRVAGQKHAAHRLAFLYMTGEWPKNQIDHKNRTRHDNSWANLREATASQNCVNRVLYCRKYSLPRGVTFYRGRFLTRVKAGPKSTYLGSYATPEEAHAVYIAAATKAFGEFLPDVAA